jgi:hypothetical protein
MGPFVLSAPSLRRVKQGGRRVELLVCGEVDARRWKRGLFGVGSAVLASRTNGALFR